jgi:hypothetical protein
MVNAEMRRCTPAAVSATQIKINNTLFESRAVPGHEKPPKVEVQLSGVSSASRPFSFLFENAQGC